MSIDALGRFIPNHKVYDQIGNVIPDPEYCEGIRPHFPFRPAAWLPVQFYNKYDTFWNVIMPGKIVALDVDGNLMPAHYGLGASAVVTYTSNDITAGTIDITTGVACTTATSYNTSDIDGATYGFMGRKGISFKYDSYHWPIGVAPYAYKQWAGNGGSLDDGWNPYGLKENNVNPQNQVAVLCDYVIRLPLVPGQVASESVNTNWTNSTATFGTKAWINRSYLITTGRYATATGILPVTTSDKVVGLVLDNYPVAKNTTRTPITSNITGLLVNERTSIAAVTASGDFFVDYKVGVIFVYSATGNSLPTVTTSSTVTYFHYATAPTVYSAFACVLATTTELIPGSYLGVGAASNFVRVDASSASTLFPSIVGQVLGFEVHPRDALDRVRTAYSPALRTNSTGAMSNATLASSSVGLGQMDQMPGSANGGYPDDINFTGAANLNVIINLIGR